MARSTAGRLDLLVERLDLDRLGVPVVQADLSTEFQRRWRQLAVAPRVLVRQPRRPALREERVPEPIHALEELVLDERDWLLLDTWPGSTSNAATSRSPSPWSTAPGTCARSSTASPHATATALRAPTRSTCWSSDPRHLIGLRRRLDGQARPDRRSCSQSQGGEGGRPPNSSPPPRDAAARPRRSRAEADRQG